MQLLRSKGRVDAAHFASKPGVEVANDIAQLPLDCVGPVELHLRRPAIVAVHAALEIGEVFAQALLSGDGSALLGGDDLLAESIDGT